MSEQQESPKLDYFTQPAPVKAKSTRFLKGVGLTGFLVYGAIALPFYFLLIMAAEEFIRAGVTPALFRFPILVAIPAVCTWRAVNGLLQFLR